LVWEIALDGKKKTTKIIAKFAGIEIPTIE
jgi:hypothetical protein